MLKVPPFLKCAVTAWFAGSAAAMAGPTVEDLLRELADPATADWQRVEADLVREWSKSGSPAMDLLLRRGEAAIEAGDLDAAIEHLTALTDHAPDFAEGWNARATAYYLDGQFGPSIADIRHVLALNPNHYGALAGLGMMLEEVGRGDEAAAAYRAALSVHPHQPRLTEALDRIDRESQGTKL